MKEIYSPLDAQAILARLDEGSVPANWRVFRTSRKQILALCVVPLTIISLIIGFLMFYLFTNPDHHPPAPSGALQIISIVSLCFFLLMLLLSLSTWFSMKDIVYVFTPVGLVRRNYNKQKKIFAVSYQDIVEVRDTGNTVIVEIEGIRQTKRLHCQLLDPPVDEALFTFEKMYIAFKNRKAEFTLSSGEPSSQTEENDQQKLQPPANQKMLYGMFAIFFLAGFFLYVGISIAVTRHTTMWPLDPTGWAAWLASSIVIFLLAEGPLLLLTIALRKIAENMLNDERFNAEQEETIQSRRLVHRASRLWVATFFLPQPAFTVLVPISVATFLRSPLQSWLQHQIQAAISGNYLALLTPTLLLLFSCLTFIPLIHTWRWYAKA